MKLKTMDALISLHENIVKYECLSGRDIEVLTENTDVTSDIDAIKNIDELFDIITSVSDIVTNNMPENVSDVTDDYESFTDRKYGNKCWNEIPCSNIVLNLLSRYLDFTRKKSDTKRYIISLYEFNDYTVAFDTLDDAQTFIENCYDSTYTAYMIEGNHLSELFWE